MVSTNFQSSEMIRYCHILPPDPNYLLSGLEAGMILVLSSGHFGSRRCELGTAAPRSQFPNQPCRCCCNTSQPSLALLLFLPSLSSCISLLGLLQARIWQQGTAMHKWVLQDRGYWQSSAFEIQGRCWKKDLMSLSFLCPSPLLKMFGSPR